jgi:hypothetical protein
MGYEDLNHLLVTKLNGVELKRIEDVPEAIEKAFSARVNWVRAASPGVLLVANEMDGLFCVN